jgi:hypothetical protein
VPLIQGAGQPPYLAISESTLLGGQTAVALGGYHMILSGDLGTTRLYDLASDPLEMKDIAGEDPGRAEVMLRHVHDWKEKVEAFTFAGGEAASVGEETLEQLKSLGYVQ